MPTSSSTRAHSASRSGDTLPPIDTVVLAAETAVPLFLVATPEAEARLQVWGRPALYVPARLDHVEPSLLQSTNPVILPEGGMAARRWADRLGTSLVQAGLVVKVLALDGGATAWLLGTGTAMELDHLETLTPRFDPPKSKGVHDADWMVAYALERVTLYRTQSGGTFVGFEHGGAWQVGAVNSTLLQDLLAMGCYEALGRCPRDNAFAVARQMLSTMARAEGTLVEPFVRVGRGPGGTLCLDLCNDRGEVVQITPATGWAVVPRSPVLFVRSDEATALPHPAPRVGTSDALAAAGFQALCRFVHTASLEDAVLLWGFLVYCLRPGGPFPGLSLVAPQATGKSVTAGLIVSAIDPDGSGGLKSLPDTDRDMAVSLGTSYVMGYDNVSRLTDAQSNLLCRLCTGFSHGERELGSDNRRVHFNGIRPFVMTGIVDVFDKHDLASRVFTLRLERPPVQVDEHDLKAAFAQELPTILAGLLECAWMSTLLGPGEETPGTTRFKAFEQWSLCAARLAAGEAGREAMVRALRSNQGDSLQELAEGDPLLQLVAAFVETNGPWRGKMTELYEQLAARFPAGDRLPRHFPVSPQALSRALGTKAPGLRALGIDFVSLGHQGVGSSRGRYYTLERSRERTTASSSTL